MSGWRPASLPKMREQLARAGLRSADRMDELATQTQDAIRTGRRTEPDLLRTTGHTPAGLTALAGSLRQESAITRHASCWWITEPMTHVALDASTDLPEWTPLAVLPDSTGILIWHAELPGIPWPAAPEQVWTQNALGHRTPPLVTPHGALWFLRPADGMLQIDVLTRTDTLDPAALHGSWHDTPLISLVTVLMPPDQPARPPDDQPWAAGLVHCLGATWLLSQQPNVATRHTAEVDRADGRALRRAQLPTDVQIVDLRSKAAPTLDGDRHEPTGRHLSHRHLVRGHWRQQACGPQLTQRRPTWIAPYLKGPDGTPLVERERVMIWRR